MARSRDQVMAELITEVWRVWARNPHKTLLQTIDRASAATGTFVPGDATDEALLSALEQIGPGLAAPRSIALSASSDAEVIPPAAAEAHA